MSMKGVLALVTFLSCIGTGSSNAATLVGESVNGYLDLDAGVNYFDPVTGYAPATALNKAGLPVVVSVSDLEFGFFDSVNGYSVDVDETGFTLNRTAIAPFVGSRGFKISLTSSAFVGLSLLELSDNFFNGVTATLLGDTVGLSWRGTNSGDGYAARFSLTAAPSTVPVPSAWLLFVSGFGVLGILRRARLSRQQHDPALVKG